MKYIAIAVFSLLATSFALPLQAAPIPVEAGCAPAAGGAAAASYVSDDGERQLMQVSQSLVIEKLTGQRAVDHFRRLREEKPQRFVGSGEALARRGYKPTREVIVYRTLNIAGQLAPADREHLGLKMPSPLFASDAYASSEGEIIFWSWDDGSDATWEGQTYVERYSDGAYANYDGQSSIASEDWYGVWTEQTSSGGGGGDGDCAECVIQPTSNGGPAAFVPAVIGGSASPGSGRLDLRQASYLSMWDGYLGCVVSRCAGCGVACAITGPGWPKCAGGCCVGMGIVACGLERLLPF